MLQIHNTCTSIDGYVEISLCSFFYWHFSPVEKMRHFKILLFLDVNIINIGFFQYYNGEVLCLILSAFSFCICMISPEDGHNCRPKHVAYIRTKRMSEHLCCCIGLITIDNIHCLPLLTKGNDFLQSQIKKKN